MGEDGPRTDSADGLNAKAKPAYSGRLGEVVGIILTNTLLGIVSLGVYRFWGKTRLRRYLWSRVSFDGEPLEYLGTPRELLIGFLIVLLVIAPMFVLEIAAALWPGGEWVAAVGQTLWFLAFVVLLPVAVFRARRYRLSRTLWRGIRFGQSGSSWAYCLRVLLWRTLQFASVGLLTPFARTALQRYRTRQTWYGNARFAFDGHGRDLFGRWIVAWLLLLPSLFLSYVWYRAAELRYFAARTRAAGVGFEMTVRGRSFAVYALAHALVLLPFLIAYGVLLVGLDLPEGIGNGSGQPPAALKLGAVQQAALFAGAFILYLVSNAVGVVIWVHGVLGLLCRETSVLGALDYAVISQSDRDAPRHGEGLADMLDVGGL